MKLTHSKHVGVLVVHTLVVFIYPAEGMVNPWLEAGNLTRSFLPRGHEEFEDWRSVAKMRLTFGQQCLLYEVRVLVKDQLWLIMKTVIHSTYL